MRLPHKIEARNTRIEYGSCRQIAGNDATRRFSPCCALPLSLYSVFKVRKTGLKCEYGLDALFVDLKQAQVAVQEAIWLYNYERPHLSLNYCKPAEIHGCC